MTQLTKSQIAARAVRDILPMEIDKAMARMHRVKSWAGMGPGGRSSVIVAAQLGIGHNIINHAKSVLRQSPDTFARILAGEISVEAAYSIVNGKSRRRKKGKPKWSVVAAFNRLEAAVQHEGYLYNKYGTHPDQRAAIGKWLVERGKQWNSERTFGNGAVKITEVCAE